MARLHVLGDWHGPGEEKAARRLAAELPDEGWDVVAGRNVPDGTGTVDLDLVVVGPQAVFVVEEKAWGRHVVTGEVSWLVNGRPRHSPANQVSHATKVLAGRLRTWVTGWRQAIAGLPRGVRAVTGHVLLSHVELQLDDAAALGDELVLTLSRAAGVLVGLDAAFPPDLAPLRPALMAFLLGLPPRGPAPTPRAIHQYTVLERAAPHGDTITYIAHTPAGEPVFLTCVPTANAPDRAEAERVASREHDALAMLAAQERAWRVQSWFDWDGFRVTPVMVALDGVSLGKLAAQRRPEPDGSGRVPAATGAAVVHDAFAALAAVHGKQITHRALQLRSVEVTPAGRVRFRDFGRSRIAAAGTVAPSLDDDHPSVAFQPPGVPLAFRRAPDDVYALALCLVQWLHGDPGDDPDHEAARKLAPDYPGVGPLLARCLAADPAERPTAADAARATAPAPPPEADVLADGAVLGGRYRLIRELGRGAWAVTWLAEDQHLRVHRTVKHMDPERVGPDQVRKEYEHAAALRSYHCAQVHDRLDRPAPGVLVQEYVPGQSLEDLVRGGQPLGREQTRRIAVDVLTGLADAHDRHLLHRDVSPGNVIVRDDGRAVLIDFGLASRAERARSVVGTPPYTAPEVWERRRWSTAADVYSAAASVLHAVLGRFPYAGPSLEERKVLVEPTAEDTRRVGKALLDALYAGVDPDPATRPGDARAYAERVARAADPETVRGDRLVNPTVDALRGLYRHSGVGNAGNRGVDDVFAHETYRPTRLDTDLLPAVVRGALDVVVLSGNPGDGKTSFLVAVGRALDERGAVTLHADAAGWRKRHDGRTFAAVYDASESHGALRSDDLIHRALEPGDGDDPARRTVLLAANDGRIAQFLADHAARYPRLAAELTRQRTAAAAPGARTVLVDLKRRALALPDRDAPAVGTAVLDGLTEPARWAACDGCAARVACPIRRNAERMRAPGARRAVAELLLTSHLRRRRRATVRDVRSAFAWLITADVGCATVHDELAGGQDPAAGPHRTAFDLAFSPASGDYLVSEWAELDPGALPAPAAARRARRDPGLVRDLGAVEGGDMVTLKRALFFGEWAAPGVEHEVRSYRHLEEYLAALAEPGTALPRVLLGVSRVLAYVGYERTDLALRDRTYDDPAVRSIVVVKELPSSAFALVTVTTADPYVESFPDRLELRHAAGARLAITLDTAELLLRAADGEVLADPASAALRQEVARFGHRLRLEPGHAVTVVDGAGRALRAVARDGRIVREHPGAPS